MKTELVSAISAAIAGVLISYFLCGVIFVKPIEDVTIKVIDSEVITTLTDPDPEVFNYKALNPTVEVFVGNCAEYDNYGECAEVITEETTTIEETTPSESPVPAESPTPSETTNPEILNGPTN